MVEKRQTTKMCPYCASTLRKEVLHCPFCMKDISGVRNEPKGHSEDPLGSGHETGEIANRKLKVHSKKVAFAYIGGFLIVLGLVAWVLKEMVVHECQKQVQEYQVQLNELLQKAQGQNQ